MQEKTILGRAIESVRNVFTPASVLRENKTKITSAGGASVFKKSGEKQAVNLKLYENLYRKIPMAHAAINTTANQGLAQGFHFVKKEDGNDNAVGICKEFSDRINLLQILDPVVKEMLIFGTSYIEIVKTGGTIERLKNIDPKSMTIFRDDDSKISKFQQKVGTEEIDLDVSDIACFKYNVLSNEAYGTSTLRSLVNIFQIKLNSEDSLGVILDHRANPTILWKVGTDTNPGTSTMADEVKSRLDDLQKGDDPIMPHYVDAKVIGVEGEALRPEQYLRHIEDQAVAGLEVPEVLLGRGRGATEATAQVQIQAFDRRIRYIQNILSRTIEDQILKPLLEMHGMVEVKDIPLVVFQGVSLQDLDSKVKRLLALQKGSIITADEVRKELGLGDLPEELKKDDLPVDMPEPKDDDREQPLPKEPPTKTKSKQPKPPLDDDDPRKNEDLTRNEKSWTYDNTESSKKAKA